MQKLFFEPAWDKTIAQVDREKIIHFFQTVQTEADIHLFFLWDAVNHKKEQLVTVLIHNPKTEPLQFEQTAIAYQTEIEPIKTAFFDLPLQIPAQTSVPWTFIFSDLNQTEQTAAYLITNSRQ